MYASSYSSPPSSSSSSSSTFHSFELGQRRSKMLLLSRKRSRVVCCGMSLGHGCSFGRFAPPSRSRRSSPRDLVSSASLNSVISYGSAIAAAAAVTRGAATTHSVVSSAIAHVTVTAVAIASGACLSTKVDFLWPRVEDKPDSITVGVDITGYPIFNDAEVQVQKASAFAKEADSGQLRKTGESYLTHCIHTGRILAALVPSSGKRATDTVLAGILHDVIDDACTSLSSIEEVFGDDVAKLVAGVSRLSYINQVNNLRGMLLGMDDDPCLVLIKLVDHLHTMRTIYSSTAKGPSCCTGDINCVVLTCF